MGVLELFWSSSISSVTGNLVVVFPVVGARVVGAPVVGDPVEIGCDIVGLDVMGDPPVGDTVIGRRVPPLGALVNPARVSISRISSGSTVSGFCCH